MTGSDTTNTLRTAVFNNRSGVHTGVDARHGRQRFISMFFRINGRLGRPLAIARSLRASLRPRTTFLNPPELNALSLPNSLR